MEREANNAWAVQEEIARAIVAAVNLELTPEEQRASVSTHSPHPDAFELYLKGRHAAQYMRKASQCRAIEIFQAAIAIDPSYSLAFVGLARCYLNLAELGLAPPIEVAPRARQALEQALALDQNLPEAHALMATTIARHEWDWPRAEEHYRRALALAPNVAEAHQEYASGFLAPHGRFEEAFAENRRARELDPFSPVFIGAHIWLLIASRRLA